MSTFEMRDCGKPFKSRFSNKQFHKYPYRYTFDRVSSDIQCRRKECIGKSYTIQLLIGYRWVVIDQGVDFVVNNRKIGVATTNDVTDGSEQFIGPQSA
ncbi:hypothetical protein PPL_08350 [Heterostelium album PN500]|uniref:Uncharacterized protein n=1 Tax=Heterostelium pallidum (strain ATCC 26659 / Pp 5 / PN500) TaxID=670386 RepID=D3BHY2_HETP5|nr:hypothetical protein PPL_08350 [Heterostelium album PN500]EFA78882.1 hypothetical protein PPL_08350 [Heterostelium album PN500]|eukprot:XP_020431006.1 hypothetical protein PPL_08350 [Heterostelium album PN500]